MDDTPYNLFVLEEILKGINKSIYIEKADSADKSIELVKKYYERKFEVYDIILMDI